MRIAILTLPLHTNYGGILQAYALQTVLERMGHNVMVISRPLSGRKISNIEKISSLLKFVIKFIINPTKKRKPLWWQSRRLSMVIRQHTNKFIEKYIHCRFCFSLYDIADGEFDMIVVGSDQIWRRLYSFWGTIENAYLDFAQEWNIKRVAYAASFGKDDISEYSYDEKIRCKSLLQLFNSVTVREVSGIEICSKEFGVKAFQMLDPTFLLTREDYLVLISNCKDVSSCNGVFYYILDENVCVSEILEKAIAFLACPSFRVNGRPEDPTASIEERIQGPIENWLNAFYTSDAIFTDSFHACVFSIIFNKPFLVYANMQRGVSRLKSLLFLFGLEERIIYDVTEFDRKKIYLKKSPNVEKKWNSLKEDSINYLRSIVQ